MSGFKGDSNRRLIPRWRFSRDYGGSAEFQGDPRHPREFDPELRFLNERLSRWRSTHSIATAADTVACGLTYGLLSAVSEPANFLLENADKTLPHVVRMAKVALCPTAEGDRNERQLPLSQNNDTKTQAIAIVREKRIRLRQHPNNPLAWIDMSRGYAILGQSVKAKSALQRALTLAPDHRVVLRLGARFLVHMNDPAQAHDLLHRHPRTKSDPWLMASEIAVASVAQRHARCMKIGSQLLAKNSLPPAHMTELHSAVATQLLYDGRTRQARQGFEHSLSQPTDNTVAQAHWARQHIQSLAVSESNMRVPRGYEARSSRALEYQQWQTARDEATQWQMDEPFSSRPAVFGSYLGITLIGDYEFAVRCADIGLMAEPSDVMLLNNKAVALAYLDKLKHAIQTFRQIRSIDNTKHPTYVHMATAGLLHFRAGLRDEGRKLYRRARDLSPKGMKGRVLLHWAGEEIRLKSTEASRLRETALDCLKNEKDPAIEQLEKVVLNPASAKLGTLNPTYVGYLNDLPTLY